MTLPRAARVRRPVGGKIPPVPHVLASLDPAAEQLIEAANDSWLAGDRATCLSLLATVIEQGGEAGCVARAERFGVLLHDGDRTGAEAELATLAADPALTEGPCQLVGELLSDHGALAAALDWYDRVLGFWTEERRAAATTGVDRMLVLQRQRIRKRLGLPVA
jgi:hypothetical protein